MLLIRLSNFLKLGNLSFNKFEKSLGVSHGSISNAFKHKKNIGSNVVEKILKSYPEIRAEWLLRGEGEMLTYSEPSEDVNNYGINEGLSNKLIEQTLEFFNFQDNLELQAFLNQSLDSNSVNALEQTILSTWENKYGQDLKSIKIQLLTLFTDKLDRDQKAKILSSKSKVN